MVPGVNRRCRYHCGVLREPGRRRGLNHPVNLDQVAAGGHLRVRLRLAQRENRGHARVGPLKDCRPLIAGAASKNLPETLPQNRPMVAVVLAFRVLVKIEDAQELRIERRLERTDSKIASVRGLIHRVERATTVEQVHTALVHPTPTRH